MGANIEFPVIFCFGYACSQLCMTIGIHLKTIRWRNGRTQRTLLGLKLSRSQMDPVLKHAYPIGEME